MTKTVSHILSQDHQSYLAPIYKSEASYIIPLLSKSYPTRIWTGIGSSAFKADFRDNAVIPIWFVDVDENMFDESKKYGGDNIRSPNGDFHFKLMK